MVLLHVEWLSVSWSNHCSHSVQYPVAPCVIPTNDSAPHYLWSLRSHWQYDLFDAGANRSCRIYAQGPTWHAQPHILARPSACGLLVQEESGWTARSLFML
jgi:hypothetical protein